MPDGCRPACALLHSVTGSPASTHRTGVLRRFTDVRSLYDRPAEFLLTDFRRHDEFVGWIAQGNIAFDGDKARAEFESIFEPWT
ncbi:hypothetical protein [Nocardia carnea]|uniref:hypothetical protein n=1 Tax=Nocardia carnea TaxID=37328 RepID=UPI002455594D|nr:hypothetical protein [Nocardia carnea]